MVTVSKKELLYACIATWEEKRIGHLQFRLEAVAEEKKVNIWAMANTHGTNKVHVYTSLEPVHKAKEQCLSMLGSCNGVSDESQSSTLFCVFHICVTLLTHNLRKRTKCWTVWPVCFVQANRLHLQLPLHTQPNYTP